MFLDQKHKIRYRVKKKEALWVLLVVLLCTVFAVPNFFPRIQSFIPWIRPVSLGLDLTGGASLILEPSFDERLTQKLRARMASLQEATGASFTGLDFDHPYCASWSSVSQEKSVTEFITKNFPSIFKLGSNRICYSESYLRETENAIVGKSLSILEKRLNGLGVKEPILQRYGEKRILVEFPGIKDTSALRGLLGKTAHLTFHLVDTRFSPQESLKTGVLPAPHLMLLSSPDGRKEFVDKNVVLDGEHLSDAFVSYQDNKPVVAFHFDGEGGRIFAELTQSHVGGFLAILLDNQLISSPRISTPILGGQGVIMGNFTLKEAKDLAVLLKSGSLPAPLKVVEERAVGPSLGSDSIRSGIISFFVAFVAVIVYMFLFYRHLALISFCAVVVNILAVLAALSLLGATLTFPGIAGLILMLGMSVDSNIIIFEKIRDAYRKTNNAEISFYDGFDCALSAIWDSNLTTLFAAFCLYIFGSGSIRGFGVTLFLGVASSMFSSFYLTRFLLYGALKYKPKRIFALFSEVQS